MTDTNFVVKDGLGFSKTFVAEKQATDLIPVHRAQGPGGAALATAAKQDTINTSLGGLATAIATLNSTTSAQSITLSGISTETTLAALVAKFPTSLGAKTGATSLSVVPNTDVPFPVSQSGNWNIVNVSGTISLPTGASTETTLVALSAKLPSSVGAKTGALSLSVVPNTDTFWGTKGSVAHGVADADAPVKVGGFASSTVPTAVTTGQRVNAWYGLNGEQRTGIVNPSNSANAVETAQGSTDGIAAAITALLTHARGYVFNGTTWDRMKGDATNGTKQYSVSDPAGDGLAITPHDTNPLATAARAIYVGTGGQITLRGVNGSSDIVFKNVPSGSVLPVRAQYVRATGTTAIDMVAIY